MYWNPMSTWPDWFTTSLAMVSLGTVLCLVVFALREGFRAYPDDEDDFRLKSPQDYRSSGDETAPSAVGDQR